MCDNATEKLIVSRLWLVGIIGTSLAMFGVISNALLAVLFLSHLNYRNSPFFFLGFVAFYDTLLDFTYIILLPIPTIAEYLDDLPMYHFWLEYVRPGYFLGQISKISSVLCLIVASFERYFITKHWTFTGFEQRTRWLILIFVVLLAISVKLTTFTMSAFRDEYISSSANRIILMFTVRSALSSFYAEIHQGGCAAALRRCFLKDITIVKMPMCDRFRKYKVGNLSDDVLMSGIFNIVTIFLPFITLVFLNGGIVMMLNKQHIQELRSLITELAMGPDIMRMRRRTIRTATNTLIVIISAYLISNLLNMMITLCEFLRPDFLHRDHRQLYRITSDMASVLTVLGNLIRCPAHLISSKELREQFKLMLFGENKVGYLHALIHFIFYLKQTRLGMQ
ncbi:unnamed protein product [Anisakis simplex]|uniref:G_PROTEIN_RECEP_F1_2 domain-containing protein n=1 Tax=Anisakis simplex TaxID=6269 RepID=A0A0M3K7P6_ANISI|nr:unnamed protein product [Anisakis simplex]